MTSLPTRKSNSIFADIILRHQNYDLFLLIEDEKMPHVYKTLVDRLLDGEVKIGKIYPLKSKQNVLDRFSEWNKNASHLNKCVFIIDKDFDVFKGKITVDHPNLVELEYYTI
ncbi:DUF4435 domain-containing protein, partial [Bacillus sp. JJ722]|uniref:DUF4435 domain-containing protein n=1 Tax=Bacillus sp. JJ722 TaxID=3122973 RepID=UPI002FFE8A30